MALEGQYLHTPLTVCLERGCWMTERFIFSLTLSLVKTSESKSILTGSSETEGCKDMVARLAS